MAAWRLIALLAWAAIAGGVFAYFASDPGRKERLQERLPGVVLLVAAGALLLLGNFGIFAGVLAAAIGVALLPGGQPRTFLLAGLGLVAGGIAGAVVYWGGGLVVLSLSGCTGLFSGGCELSTGWDAAVMGLAVIGIACPIAATALFVWLGNRTRKQSGNAVDPASEARSS